MIYKGNNIIKTYLGDGDVKKLYYHDNVSYYKVTKGDEPQPTVKDYFRFVAREDSTFSFSDNDFEYSLNSGRTWTSLPASTSTPTVASGSTIFWRASGLTPSSSNGIGRCSASGDFDVEGNIMSMLFGDDFEDKTDLSSYTHAFRYMFYNNTHVVNASGMTLPATTLSNYCYAYMFYGCSSLVTASELPATTLASFCYYAMFSKTALVTAPILSATTLMTGCYSSMFNGCASLSAVTCLATSGINTNLSLGTVTYWLAGTAANGTLTRVANVSWPCDSIPSTWTVNPPYETTYAWRKAPTTDYVCNTTTHTKYYKEYYSYSDNNGCTWVHVTPESSRTSSDVIEYDSVDCGYIPPADPYLSQPFTIVGKGSGSFKFSANTNASLTNMQYSTNGTSWSTYQSNKSLTLTNGKKYYFRFKSSATNVSSNGIGIMSGTTTYDVEGNIMSLIYGDTFSAKTTMNSNYQFARLFYNQANLQSAENLRMPATTLKNGCYDSMFRGCSKLTTAPELPAKTLVSSCYNAMFRNDSKLNNIRCYATNISATSCLSNWVNGVAASGTFTKASSMSGWSTGTNGIPSGWSVKNKT